MDEVWPLNVQKMKSSRWIKKGWCHCHMESKSKATKWRQWFYFDLQRAFLLFTACWWGLFFTCCRSNLFPSYAASFVVIIAKHLSQLLVISIGHSLVFRFLTVAFFNYSSFSISALKLRTFSFIIHLLLAVLCTANILLQNFYCFVHGVFGII